MTLEIGDYFVITRGARVRAMAASVGGMEVQVPRIYDPSWQGIVLWAREVQCTLVVAEIVGVSAGAPDHPARRIGTRHVFDLAEVQWQPVGRRFAELLSRPADMAAGRLAYGPARSVSSHGCADERDQT